MQVLSETVWQEREAAHRARLHAWLEPQLSRRSHGKKHPIFDFLFEYYGFRASALKRWSPGAHVLLEGEAANRFLERSYFTPFTGPVQGAETSGVFLPPDSMPEKRREAATWILNLLNRVQSRRPMLGCYGLHEWAMVCDEGDVRHHDYEFRLPQVEIEAVVHDQPVACSHFDAFRFFSESVKGQNELNPTRDNRLKDEQPGCLHVNMDLYKWSFKLYPWLPSELIADAFQDAVFAREVDMRASPYDFTELGYQPIFIESESGREEYKREQKRIHDRGLRMRERLIAAIENVLQDQSTYNNVES